MKYTLIFTLLLVAAFSIGITSGQTRFDELVQVPESDPVFTALKEWQVDVEAQYKKSGVVISIFSPWFELPFDSLTTLLSQASLLYNLGVGKNCARQGRSHRISNESLKDCRVRSGRQDHQDA